MAAYCRSTNRGGGTAVFKSDSFHCEVNNVKCAFVQDCIFEAVLVNFVLTSLVINVACLYRPPSASDTLFICALEELLTLVNKKKGYKIICADFNYDFAEPNKKTTDILHLFLSFGLKQQFFEFSRTQGSSQSLIDNIFCDISCDLLKTKTLCNTISDHDAQILCCDLQLDRHTTLINNEYKRRNFSNENINYFNFLLSKENWNCLYDELNPETVFDDFFRNFYGLFDLAFPPLRSKNGNTTKKKNNNKWITPQLIEEGNLLRNVYRVVRSSDRSDLKSKYLMLKKKHQQNIIHAKREFNDRKVINSNNISHATWNIIKENLNISSTSDIPIFTKHISCPNESIADEFNKYFINSVKDLKSNLTVNQNYDLKITNISNSLFLSPVNSVEVERIIQTVCVKKSCGLDEIPCNILRFISKNISHVLSHIINVSFTTGTFPSQLKTAIISPVFKKGDKNLLSNYRPIALLSVFSKIFEKAYQIRFTSFLESKRILSDRQFGFTKGLSTQDAVLSFYNHILNSFNNRQKAAALFFDCAKAFDLIDHNLLLDKLHAYGIRGQALSWIKSYLSGRAQVVRIRQGVTEYISNSSPVNSGVPQGSVLGPTLFLVMINDISLNLHGNFLTVFADDTSSILVSRNEMDLSEKATKSINQMKEWCLHNGLVLNVQKTDLVHFTPLGTRQDLSLLVRSGDKPNVTVKQSEAVKFLGIFLDKNLSWEVHTENLIKKLSTKNFALLQLRKICSSQTLKCYYYSCINSLLLYGILCWGNCTNIGRVLLCQKRIIRTMFCLKPQDSCRETFKKYGILTVHNMYILEAACYVHAHIDQYRTCCDVNNYLTRNASKLYVPSFNLAQVKRGPFITSIRIYNHLPDCFKTNLNVRVFKRKLKSLLRNYVFYSLDDFFNCRAMV